MKYRHLSNRRIILGNAEYIDKLLTPSTKSKYLKRNIENEGLIELEINFQGILHNCDINTWNILLIKLCYHQVY